MRYEYTVTKDDGTAEIMQAMSYKKFKKSLLMKYPKSVNIMVLMPKKLKRG